MPEQTGPQNKRLSLATLRFALLSRTLFFEPRNNPWAVVYPEAGLVYNRIKKSGSTSIRLFLNDAVSGKEGVVPHRVIGPMELSAETLRNLRGFYIFTIFRNPYARCLSGFLEKMGSRKKGYESFPGFGDPTPDGFRSFVDYLERGGLRANRHWWPQVDLLFWPPERFDHIGQLENLENEMRHVLGERGIALPDSLNLTAPHPVEQQRRAKVTRATSKVEAFFTHDLYDRVFSLYQRDFLVGGYEPR